MTKKSKTRQRNLRSIVVDIEQSCLDYNILIFPKKHRSFFPGYKRDFVLNTNVSAHIAHVTSAEYGTRTGNPNAGQYIVGRLGKWYRHNKPRVGDRVRVRQLEKHKVYGARIL